MDKGPIEGVRKRLRVGHVSERGAINAARTLFERAQLVVDEVDGRADYGRDLLVDLTDEGSITGAVIGVQVKGDRRFVTDGTWLLPTSPKDIRYWIESSVPIAGVLWDPETSELRWANLSAEARRVRAAADDVDRIEFPDSQRLSDETMSVFVDHMRRYAEATTGLGVLRLFDGQDNVQLEGVDDCWVLGRSDARAFLLLRSSISQLGDDSLRYAIVALSHLVPHPDIAWTSRNWVPEKIKEEVRPTLSWTADEIFSLVAVVERRPVDSAGWERGGLGQCLWHLFAEDPDVGTKLIPAFRLATKYRDKQAAFRILVLIQALNDDARSAVQEAVNIYPELRDYQLVAELLSLIDEYGHVPVY